jgi:hypothetical protein
MALHRPWGSLLKTKNAIGTFDEVLFTNFLSFFKVFGKEMNYSNLSIPTSNIIY